MNLFKSLKIIPFLFIVCSIIIININNNKDYTRLKFLIWSTPSLSLGTYLAISTGSGYLLSFLFTTAITNNRYSNTLNRNDINLNSSDNNSNSSETESKNIAYDNTLIERDLKDPAPTINASFRVIGNKNFKRDFTNYNEFENMNNADLSEDEYYNNKSNYETDYKIDSLDKDWDDDTYLNW